MITRTYSELMRLTSFEERFEYLKLNGVIGEATFGFDRCLNQDFYKYDPEWRAIRDFVIARDEGFDLGVEGFAIHGMVLVHHMNAITTEDIKNRTSILLDPRYLISTTQRTHRAIHYGDKSQLVQIPISRSRNDTCPWRR